MFEHPQERMGDVRVDRRRQHHAVHVPVQQPVRRDGGGRVGTVVVRHRFGARPRRPAARMIRAMRLRP